MGALDKGQKGCVTCSDFLNGMQQIRDGVTSKQILTLYGAILRVGEMLVEMKDEQYPQTNDSCQMAEERLGEVCKKVSSIEEQLSSFEATVADFIWAMERAKSTSAREA